MNQTNSDSLPAGDVCQCGDVNSDGIVDGVDLTVAGEWIVGATLSDTFVVTRCNVVGPHDGGVSDCDLHDHAILERYLSGGQPSLADDLCADWGAP